MKIIYAFIIALILSVLAFFLAIRITDSVGAGIFLLGMLPVSFIVIIGYTKLLETFHVKAFKYVVLYTFIACYVMVFMTVFLLGSDSQWGYLACPQGCLSCNDGCIFVYLQHSDYTYLQHLIYAF